MISYNVMQWSYANKWFLLRRCCGYGCHAFVIAEKVCIQHVVKVYAR